MTIMLQANFEAQLWNDREYVAGENGEPSPIRTQDHDDWRRHGGGLLLGGCKASQCHLIVTAAAGESFRDSLTPSDPLTGYDLSKGVAIRDNRSYRWPYEPAGLDVHDNFVDFIGLQIKCVQGAAVNAMLSLGNAMTIRYCILEGGSEDEWTSHAVVTADTISVVANSLIISQGPLGIVFKYPGFVLHSTIVNVSRIKNSVGIATGTTWVFDHTTVSNTAIFGFTHAAGHYGPDTFWSARTSNNMTDAPAGDSSNGPWPFGRGTISTVDLLPGAVYGVPMADAFVRPGSDWRPSTACPLRGAGSAFGEFAVNCVVREPSCPERTTYNFDAFNIIGIARPPAGRNDVGAW